MGPRDLRARRNVFSSYRGGNRERVRAGPGSEFIRDPRQESRLATSWPPVLLIPESDRDGREDTQIEANRQAWKTDGAGCTLLGFLCRCQTSTGPGVRLPTALLLQPRGWIEGWRPTPQPNYPFCSPQATERLTFPPSRGCVSA